MSFLRPHLALLVLPLTPLACGQSRSGNLGGSALDGQPASDPSVYQHPRNGSRDGLYIDPVFTQAAAKTTHVLAGLMGTVTTNVYAQPLFVENGPGGAE